MNGIYLQAAFWAVGFAITFGMIGGLILALNPAVKGAINVVAYAVSCICGLFILAAPVFVVLSLIESAQAIQ